MKIYKPFQEINLDELSVLTFDAFKLNTPEETERLVAHMHDVPVPTKLSRLLVKTPDLKAIQPTNEAAAMYLKELLANLPSFEEIQYLPKLFIVVAKEDAQALKDYFALIDEHLKELPKDELLEIEVVKLADFRDDIFVND